MKPDDANPMRVIAGAGMGWKPHLEARTFWSGRPCRACEQFNMATVRARPSDTFGHLWPTCSHPGLPGENGQPTQPGATCDKWTKKPSPEAKSWPT